MRSSLVYLLGDTCSVEFFRNVFIEKSVQPVLDGWRADAEIVPRIPLANRSRAARPNAPHQPPHRACADKLRLFLRET
jgi:hypothetical protein